jgi:hypothetical protein
MYNYNASVVVSRIARFSEEKNIFLFSKHARLLGAL